MNPLTVTLSASVAAEVKRIDEIPGLSPDQCAEYLIERCLDLYEDTGGDTMRLIGRAEEFQYPTFDEARAVGERIEIQAVQNHLEHPESEMLISMEVVKDDEGWNFETDHLRRDKGKGIDDRDDDQPPPFFQ
jgi:hypothetical protein